MDSVYGVYFPAHLGSMLGSNPVLPRYKNQRRVLVFCPGVEGQRELLLC